VELNHISAQDLGSQLGYYLAVNSYYTCLDELIGLTTAADTCIGQELVKTKWLVWIVVDLLVLDALLH
jgi:branched-subunit amino acid permease